MLIVFLIYVIIILIGGKKIKKKLLFITLYSVFLANNSTKGLATEYISCGGSAFPKMAIDTAHTIFLILQIVTPLVIIVLGMLDYMKAVTATINEMDKHKKTFIRRLTAGAMVFVVTTLVQMIVGFTSDSDQTNASCVTCIVRGSKACSSAQAPNNAEYPEENNNYYNPDEGFIQPGLREDAYKDKEKNENRNNNNNASNNNTNSNAGTIIVGDSRTVGMCGNSNTSYSCSTGKNAGYSLCSNDFSVSCGSQGYAWFNSTAISAVNGKLGSSKQNIVVWLGVNDLSNIDKYISKYKELANGSWKDHNVIIATVSDIRSDTQYVTKQSINSFNSKMKNAINSANISNLKICDVASVSLNDNDYQDSIHYNKSGYTKIYNYIKGCL